MSTQIKKVVSGPLTANAEGVPGVSFVGPDGAVLGALDLTQLGFSVKQLAGFPAVAVRLMVHAISQKVGDSYAGAKEAESPLAFAKEAIADTIKQILAGEWRVSAGGGVRISLLARALARVTGKTVEEAQSVVDVKSEMDDEGKPSEAGKAWRKAMNADPRIKSATADIKLEDAKKAKERAGSATGAEADLGSLFTA